MKSNFKLERIELTSIILKSQQTPDGYYWCPRFRELLTINGDAYDGEYYYDRSIFKDSVYFSTYDLDIFLSRIKKDFDVDEYKQKKSDFLSKNEDILNIKDVNSLIPPVNSYSISELIDGYEYLYYNRC